MAHIQVQRFGRLHRRRRRRRQRNIRDIPELDFEFDGSVETFSLSKNSNSEYCMVGLSIYAKLDTEQLNMLTRARQKRIDAPYWVEDNREVQVYINGNEFSTKHLHSKNSTVKSMKLSSDTYKELLKLKGNRKYELSKSDSISFISLEIPVKCSELVYFLSLKSFQSISIRVVSGDK